MLQMLHMAIPPTAEFTNTDTSIQKGLKNATNNWHLAAVSLLEFRN